MQFFKNKSINDEEMKDIDQKWALSGTILFILAISLGINGAIFTPASTADIENNRNIASLSPMLKIAWEKRAFEVMRRSHEISPDEVGKKPTAIDEMSFGFLAGGYTVLRDAGQIQSVMFANKKEIPARKIKNTTHFLSKNLSLFSNEATDLRLLFREKDGPNSVSRYEMLSSSGDLVSTIEVILDQNQNLLSVLRK